MFKFVLSFTVATIVLLGGILALPAASFSQAAGQRLACEGAGGAWVGGQCVDPATNQATDPVGIVNRIANVLLILIGTVAVLMLIVGGFRYVISAGNATALEGAKNTILFAIIGIVVAFLSYALVNEIIRRLT